MKKVVVKNRRKAYFCIVVLVVFALALPKQSVTQSTSPSPSPTPDAGVPETTVTDGDTMITTDINGVESISSDTTTLALGSTTVATTSKSSSTATTSPSTTASASPSFTSTSFASTDTTSGSTTDTPTSSLTCSLHGARDPGPRPTGNGGFDLRGSTTSAGVRLLNTAVHDFAQPPDGLGNEGAGQVLANAGPAGPFWFDALAVFSQKSSVNGAVDPGSSNPTIKGLGPAFNAESCFTCHSQPAIGGSSPDRNPQLALAHAFGATNNEPLGQFLKPNGPVREVRFIFADPNNPTTLDGGVHEIFSIQGRTDAPPNCQLLQPDLNHQINSHNAIFRIPIPTFGEGLVEGVTDNDLANNLLNFANDKASFHIAGRVNRNGNDGTVTRFGWKAQNKSMFLFSGEASNVEMGVTNEVFQNEKVPGLGCVSNGLSEDNTHVITANPPGADSASTTSLVSSAVENFSLFMRLNGAPAQCAFNSGLNSNGSARCVALTDPSVAATINRGKQLFGTPSNGGVGCVLCHSASFTSGPSDVVGLSNRTFTPFSDFALHHMGGTLADGVNQGVAGPDEFRTAPLWGVGQRLFFMHDGRATDLLQAIEAHFSDPNVCFNTSASEDLTVNGHRFLPSSSTQSCGSEANESVRQFNALCATDKNALLAYLRSL